MSNQNQDPEAESAEYKGLMAKSRPDSPATDGETDHLAVGLRASEDANFFRNILHARDLGLAVFVAHLPDDEDWVADIAAELGATVTHPAVEEPDPEITKEHLATSAVTRSHPGIVIPRDPASVIDYHRTLEAVDGEEGVHRPVLAKEASDLDVVVAIPAYNEAATIADVVTEADPYCDEVLVIDDGSHDATVDEAAAAGATVVEHEHNKGYGAALQTAFTEADERGAEYLSIIDGDGQHDASDIPQAVETQEDTNADIVIGSRFVEGSDTDVPLYRRLGLTVINSLTNLSMGVLRPQSWVRDTQSGFRTYNQTAIKSLAADDSLGEGMNASTDILYHAHQRGYELEEIGTTIDYDVENASSHNPVSHGISLVSNILKTVEEERPIMSLGVPGFMSSFAGLGFGYWTFHNYLNSGAFPLGLAITSAFFALAGIFACFTAIILHSLNSHS